jgi:hypothetical protein
MKGKAMQTIHFYYGTSSDEEEPISPPDGGGGAGAERGIPEEPPVKGGRQRSEDPGADLDEPIYPPEDGDGGTEGPMDQADNDPTPIGDYRPQEDNGSGEDARPQEPLEDENVSWPTELGSNGEGDEDDTAWPTEKDGLDGEPEE